MGKWLDRIEKKGVNSPPNPPSLKKPCNDANSIPLKEARRILLAGGEFSKKTPRTSEDTGSQSLFPDKPEDPKWYD